MTESIAGREVYFLMESMCMEKLRSIHLVVTTVGFVAATSLRHEKIQTNDLYPLGISFIL
jgi:hypothetical protein